MNPFEPTAASKPRTLSPAYPFPYLMTFTVAATLFSLLFAQATLRDPKMTQLRKGADTIMNSAARAASKH